MCIFANYFECLAYETVCIGSLAHLSVGWCER